ncbi:hypothetical protein ICN42_10620 [Polynucleobacter sp. 71A-WALBACH]|uniref:hypothetical protein n=1 Tax=Polynucleobacter sp. 71A-WALBACH TaxID=2689097 RepID=UPI001C0E2FBC|nr:hypothetical protein [Polynucleobacter sp. 71A-WALBACH]MBU3594542.1 hypothetical protein [Polynucleobacter sp. 71A-WALBACH]
MPQRIGITDLKHHRFIELSQAFTGKQPFFCRWIIGAGIRVFIDINYDFYTKKYFLLININILGKRFCNLTLPALIEMRLFTKATIRRF